jgi:hypothetical protein
MEIATIAGLPRQRAQLHTHDGWTRDEVLAYQSQRLAELRAYATAHSPFYQELHRGLEGAPLSSLPVVTKATLMEHFDDLVTDRNVHLADVERYVSTASATDRFRDRYRGSATAVIVASGVDGRIVSSDALAIPLRRVPTGPISRGDQFLKRSTQMVRARLVRAAQRS